MSDLISRQAAIEAVGDVYPLDYNKQAILHRIKALPTIDPVRHGRWIEYATEKWKCSECGNHEDLLDGKHHGWCGECGAKMER